MNFFKNLNESITTETALPRYYMTMKSSNKGTIRNYNTGFIGIFSGQVRPRDNWSIPR